MAERTVTFDTTKGTIVVQLFESEAPSTSANFVDLIKKGFYNGLAFHRYEPGFVIQGGDPVGNGTGGSGKNISLEVSHSLKHDGPGVLAMARSSHPDSASSQFYFTLKACPHLDMNYAVFGKVITGLDVVTALRVGDVMNKVTVN